MCGAPNRVDQHRTAVYCLKVLVKIATFQLPRGFTISGVLDRKKSESHRSTDRHGRYQDAANISEVHRESDSSPAGATQHRRQLQPRRQGHSQTSRRSPSRQYL